jgi:hypothetical protein
MGRVEQTLALAQTRGEWRRRVHVQELLDGGTGVRGAAKIGKRQRTLRIALLGKNAARKQEPVPIEQG